MKPASALAHAVNGMVHETSEKRSVEILCRKREVRTEERGGVIVIRDTGISSEDIYHTSDYE